MYATGNITNFEPRLHELTSGQADLNNFLTEGRGYLATLSSQPSGQGWQNTSGKWEKEARLQKYRYTGSGIVLNQQQF